MSYEPDCPFCESCTTCNGTGKELIWCGRCKGTGFGILAMPYRNCLACGGLGRYREKCSACNGQLGRQLSRIVELKRGDDAGVHDCGIVHRHRPVPSYGSRRSPLTVSSRSARSSATSIAGAVANMARTSSLGTAWRLRIGTILARGSPLRVSVYVRPCRRPRVTDPESATNWRTLTSVARSLEDVMLRS
jgi:hypothetical protein